MLFISWEIIFFRDHVENEVWRLVSDLFYFFKKALYKVKKVSGQQFLLWAILNFNKKIWD